MSRYIDADTAIDALHSWGCLTLESAERIVNRECPTADVVEVVRCKDCKCAALWIKPQGKVIGECMLRKWYSVDEQFPLIGENDFCSNGERKTE